VGDTLLAVINSFWSAVRDDSLNVNKVYLLCSDDDEKRGIKGTYRNFEKLKNKIAELAQILKLPLTLDDIHLKIIKEEDPVSVYNAIKRLYKELGKQYEFCIDITGGRKTMSSGALLFAKDKGLKCYYFWLFDPRKNGSKKLDELAERIDYELIRVHELWKK